MMKLQPRYKKGDRIANRYRVHQALMGGMGEVYLCLDLEEMIPLALKTFQQRYLTDAQRLRQAFEQEVATWVALEKHPNIVRCFHMTTLDRQPFMVLEWVAGEEGRGTDLRSWLRNGPLDLQLALQIAIDICQGLLHAQAKQPGMVHRDLKPENILIAQGGLAKITDFGLAEIAQAAGLLLDDPAVTSADHHTLIGGLGITGTPAYMAPEQWRGEPLDTRTDIYALGCILYELLTGASPFPVALSALNQDPTWLDTLHQAHEHAIVPALPSGLPATLNELVQRCLAKAASARYAQVTDLLSHLTSLYQALFHQAPRAQPDVAAFTTVDYNNRGVTYAALGQREQALADYTQALTLDPNYAQAYLNKGINLALLGQLQEALLYLGKAAQLGEPNGAQAAGLVRQQFGITAPQIDPDEQALTAFAAADSPVALQQVVTRFPWLRQSDFIATIEQAIAQQLPPEHRPAFTQRLTWLRQIANTQPRSTR